MTTRLYVALHGGASYSFPDTAAEYASLREAADEWDSRRRSGYSFKHLDREHNHYVYCPGWGDSGVYGQTNDGRDHAAFAYWVPDGDPDLSINEHGVTVFSTCDNYPDRELTVGPRGGLRWERC